MRAFYPGGRWELVLGPPGTGKTTTLLRCLEGELSAGVHPSEVAYVSFTRAARQEAASRAARTLDCGPEDFTWCRTIHSTAFRLLGARKEEILNARDMKAFGDAYGYKFGSGRFQVDEGEEDPGVRPVATEDDKLLAAMEWVRARMLPLEEGPRRAPFLVPPRQYRLFVQRYNELKRELHRRDFYDLLEECLVSDLRPPVTRAIIDEAQDLSPIQVELVQRWFGECERVYIAGDDDQAIYGFSGADSRWVLSLAERFPSQVLQQSFRVPRLPYEVAKHVIGKNQARVPKTYYPSGEEGEMSVFPRDGIVNLIDESEQTFILARHWKWVRSFANLLRREGIAFAVERHPHLSPLGAKTAIRAYRAAVDLQRGKQVSSVTCRALLSQISSGKHGGNVLPRGAKKRAKENESPVTLATLSIWGLDLLVAELRRRGPHVLGRLPRDLLGALDALVARYGRIPTKPHVTAMSMHASKGREADTVIVLPELSRRAYRSHMLGTKEEQEAENRVAYVALTRARRRLLVAHPLNRRAFPYDSYANRVLAQPAPRRDEDDWWFG